jgi:leader peptidase (prepilin peptidase)/N-methyltransferase
VTPDQTLAFFGAFAALFGLLLGSFLNVVISRLPEDRSVAYPPSHCPACGHDIRWFDNIPVISWLVLRARCRDCGNPISSLYPTIELLTGCLAWLLWHRILPDPAALDLAHLAAFGVHLGFVCMLVAVTFIDIRHYIIPDEFSIYAVPLGVGASLLLTWLGYPEAVSWQQSVLGALAGGGTLLAIMGLWWLVRRQESMGLGDVKLLAMIGAFLGLAPAVPMVIVVSAVAGSLVGVPLALLTRRRLSLALPFGPFLALGAIAWLLHGPELMQLYLHYVGRLYFLMAG